MAAGTYQPDSNIHYTDNDGNPLAGGFLQFYAAGTTTPLDTYSDPDLDVSHVNPDPITLNAYGWSTNPVFFQVASYKLVVSDANGVMLWTRDNIAAVSLTTTPTGVAVYTFYGDPTSPCPASQTSYPSGTTYDKLLAGSAIWSLDSSSLVGEYVLVSMLMVSGAGSVTLGLFNLTDGTPDTPLVTVSGTSTTGERQESATIAFAAAGSSKDYALKIKTTGSVLGWAWAAQIVRKA